MNYIYDFFGKNFEVHFYLCSGLIFVTFILSIYRKPINNSLSPFFGFMSFCYVVLLFMIYSNFNIYNKHVISNDTYKIVYPANPNKLLYYKVYDNSPIRINKTTLKLSRSEDVLIKIEKCEYSSDLGIINSCLKSIKNKYKIEPHE